jgi:hypothetical protein
MQPYRRHVDLVFLAMCLSARGQESPPSLADDNKTTNFEDTVPYNLNGPVAWGCHPASTDIGGFDQESAKQFTRALMHAALHWGDTKAVSPF